MYSPRPLPPRVRVIWSPRRLKRSKMRSVSCAAMPFDAVQVEEVFLTAAQSAFAVGVLSSLSISRGEAVMLLVPFLAQFGFQSTGVRYGFSGFYLAGLAYILLRRPESRSGLVGAVRAALSVPRRER